MNYKDLTSVNTEGLYRQKLTIDRKYALGDLARLMQLVTENAMAKLGTNYIQLKEIDLIWVLCFSDIKISRMPEKDEMVDIFSWPGADKFGMCSRRYVMFSSDGDELVTCASFFSTVDKETRKMTNPSEAGITFPVIEIPNEPALPKISVKGTECSEEEKHKVNISEIDKNDHVNNSYYLDWVENIYLRYSDVPNAADNENCTASEENTDKRTIDDSAGGKSKESDFNGIKSVWINYAKEIRLGDTVVFQFGQNGDIMSVNGLVDGDICFKAVVNKPA